MAILTSRRIRSVLLLLLILFATTRPLAAQEAPTADLSSPPKIAELSWSAAVGALSALPASPVMSVPAVLSAPAVETVRSSRPQALTSMYISLGVLEVLDVHSSYRAMTHGARETNP